MIEPKWYGSTQIAKVLGVDLWRIKNFTQGKAYRLPEAQLIGSGKRRMRLYRATDVLRFAVANELEQSGHDPSSIGKALDSIPTSLLGDWSEQFAAVAGKAKFSTKADNILCWTEGKWKVLKARDVHTAVKQALEIEGDSRPIVMLNLTSLFVDTIQRVMELEGKGEI